MTVRCKFRCNSALQSESSRSKKVEDPTAQGGFRWENEPFILHTVTFTPVYSSKPESENKRFWDATPSGKLEFGTIREMPFEIGKEYYLDISPAPAE